METPKIQANGCENACYDMGKMRKFGCMKNISEGQLSNSKGSGSQ
jgi:hypothetical protein